MIGEREGVAFWTLGPDLVRNVNDLGAAIVVGRNVTPMGVIVGLERDFTPKQESRRSGLVDKGFKAVDLDRRWAATLYLNPILVIGQPEVRKIVSE